MIDYQGQSETNDILVFLFRIPPEFLDPPPTSHKVFVIVFQIKVSNLTKKILRGRSFHSATAISHTPTLVEVIVFGGCPEWPKDYKTHANLPPIGNTVVLRFGESTSCVWYRLEYNFLCSYAWAHDYYSFSLCLKIVYYSQIVLNPIAYYVDSHQACS